MGHQQNWSEMMTRAQSGDAAMYNRLLTEVSQYLLSYLNHKLRSANDAQDILQEILISVHNARHTYDSKYPFKPWLFTITQSRLIDFWRKNSRRVEKDALFDSDAALLLMAEAEVTTLEVSDLNKAIEKLPEQQQLILKGIKIDGKSIKDLSIELSMSESAVKVAAHRAYKSVAETLEVFL